MTSLSRTILPIFILCFSLNLHAFSEDFSAHKPNAEGEMRISHMEQQRLMFSDGPLKIDVHLRNFGSWDRIKLESAAKILLQVMNSELFKQEVLTHTYQGEIGFHENKGMSNLEIYEHLMTGAEDLMPEIDYTMNFDLTLYRSLNPWSKVKGYTKPDTMRIWLNTKFYRRTSWTAIDVAANMAHEWVHKMGFGHSYNYTPQRPYTVPYAIGNIVGRVAKELGLEDTSL